jgi:hypothetical protein
LRRELSADSSPAREFQPALRLNRILDAAGFAGNPELIEAVCPHIWAQAVSVGDMIAMPSLSAAGALAAITEGKLPNFLLSYSAGIEHWQQLCTSRGAIPATGKGR